MALTRGKGLLGLLVGLSGDDDLRGGGCVVGGEGRGAGTERQLLVPRGEGLLVGFSVEDNLHAGSCVDEGEGEGVEVGLFTVQHFTRLGKNHCLGAGWEYWKNRRCGDCPSGWVRNQQPEDCCGWGLKMSLHWGQRPIYPVGTL